MNTIRRRILQLLAAVLVVAYLGGCAAALLALKRGAARYAANEDMAEAALRGDAKTVRKLLAQGANPNYCGDGGSVPVDRAWQSENRDTVNTVLEFKPDLAKALVHAVFQNKADYLRFLLEHGADPNTKDSDGRTVLQIARSYEYKEVCVILEKAIHGGKHG